MHEVDYYESHVPYADFITELLQDKLADMLDSDVALSADIVEPIAVSLAKQMVKEFDPDEIDPGVMSDYVSAYVDQLSSELSSELSSDDSELSSDDSDDSDDSDNDLFSVGDEEDILSDGKEKQRKRDGTGQLVPSKEDSQYNQTWLQKMGNTLKGASPARKDAAKKIEENKNKNKQQSCSPSDARIKNIRGGYTLSRNVIDACMPHGR